jgi:hypothetical protein
VILAQQGHHIFGVSALGEAREAAQVAEKRGDFSAMTFQLLFSPRRHDQISHLRRQEAPQPAMRSISPTAAHSCQNLGYK